MNELTVFGVEELPKIQEGDDLTRLIIRSLDKQGKKLEHKDIVIVTSKIVSKAEGRLVEEKDIQPSPLAIELSKSTGKTPNEIEMIFRESSSPVKITDRVMIMETKHGFICANAGIDRSNIENQETALLLPKDPDFTAKKIKESLENHYNVELAVIISDTFGRPWRMGQTNVAIGVSGMLAIRDYKGEFDQFGYELKATEIAVADQVASAAELVMGKSDGIPVAVVRGYSYPEGDGTSKDLVRPREMDLFR
ncbi:coenzyme F420-0:L-glutamate ligase [Alkalihalobacterium alkalinitrilicum]|uniref:coenzyme F420-0:L-glutamate ligase n=1 Tax=Alkalihalobacterium alkalinitrilicum TaxID=427920 RepID=UPI0009959AAA|nr:coenzyme F420-0:L-glutamate ligase [Alkalihalobacterium alkalinitrilicum]